MHSTLHPNLDFGCVCGLGRAARLLGFFPMPTFGSQPMPRSTALPYCSMGTSRNRCQLHRGACDV
eukprot:UN16409